MPTGAGAVAVDVEKAVAFLSDTVGNSSVEVTLSLDDKYVFVRQEYGSMATGSHGVVEGL